MFSIYISSSLGHNDCVWKINLRILWNHIMKSFQAKHGQFNSIIFLKTFSFEGSKTFALLAAGFFTFDMSWNLSTTFFSIGVFFHNHSRITGLQVKGEGISLTRHYHFHPLQRYLDISRAITGESTTQHIASSLTGTENWFPSASC